MELLTDFINRETSTETGEKPKIDKMTQSINKEELPIFGFSVFGTFHWLHVLSLPMGLNP